MRIQNDERAWGFLAGLFVLLLGLLVNASCACMSSDLRTLHRQYDASVLIEASCIGDSMTVTRWFGSGVIVGPRRILTVAHVTRTPKDALCAFSVTTIDGKERLAQPLVQLPDVDLASMVLLDGEVAFDPGPIRFGGKSDIGAMVCASPSFPRRAHKCGEVQPYGSAPGDIVFDAIVEPGNSGSALYDQRGNLIGLVTHLTYCANRQWCGARASSLQGHTKELLP